jgi:broad specificity phosphatase PhoE
MILWIRHCSTSGQEPEAPLTDAGHHQARELTQLLMGFGIMRIVSSPYRRAVQSVEPFARTARKRRSAIASRPARRQRSFRMAI